MTRFFFNSPLIHGYLGYYPRAHRDDLLTIMSSGELRRTP
jgi:hypothetical protein